MPESPGHRPITAASGSGPVVSVVIPAYNTAGFIGETLASVFAQTLSDFEIMVINDGSPDTEHLEQEIQKYRDRILYLRQNNHGPSAARNAGIRRARGEFIAFLDGDDIWMPDYLAAQVNYLKGHPAVEVSIADAVLFGGPEGEVVWRMLKQSTADVLTFEQVLRREGGQIPSAFVARRRRAIEVGMFDEQLRFAEDFEFIARLCFPDREVGYLGQVLVRQRKHPGSLTGEPRSRRWSEGELQALRRLSEKLTLTDAQSALLAKEIAACDAALALSEAYLHLSERELEDGARCLRRANSYYHDLRITLALVGLRTFPRWTARLLKWRSKRG